MIDIDNQIEALKRKKKLAGIHVHTLGNFELIRSGIVISKKDWGRDAAIQLFQFFITNRHRHSLHKEQIIDSLWGNIETKAGLQNFKIAHHNLIKVLEPNRKSRTESRYVIRQGASYKINYEDIWIDVEFVDQFIALANQSLSNKELAKLAYNEAIMLYNGNYLPDRLYNDWSTEERERIQLLILGAYINLSELLLVENPLESIRLTQLALQIDPTWEDAYRIQMDAYLNRGNRPMAIKTYQLCEQILHKEFGLDPLPETKRLYNNIKSIN